MRKRPFLPVGKTASSFNVHFKHETPIWERILKRRKGSKKLVDNEKRNNILLKYKSIDILKKKMKLSENERKPLLPLKLDLLKEKENINNLLKNNNKEIKKQDDDNKIINIYQNNKKINVVKRFKPESLNTIQQMKEKSDVINIGKPRSSVYQRLANSKLIKPKNTKLNSDSDVNKFVMSTPAISNNGGLQFSGQSVYAALNSLGDLGSAIACKNVSKKSSIDLNKNIKSEINQIKDDNDIISPFDFKKQSIIKKKDKKSILKDKNLNIEHVDSVMNLTPTNSRYNLRERKSTPNYSDIKINSINEKNIKTTNSSKKVDFFIVLYIEFRIKIILYVQH